MQIDEVLKIFRNYLIVFYFKVAIDKYVNYVPTEGNRKIIIIIYDFI